jgi:hypothetical protein
MPAAPRPQRVERENVRVPEPAVEGVGGEEAPLPAPGLDSEPVAAAERAAARRPTGRERHAEKITVYVSPEELLDLEHARIRLRADYGLVADRGRIVREAMAMLLADLEALGPESALVRRLRGR